MIIHRYLTVLAAGLGVAMAQTVTFDFDTGTPPLTPGQTTPFDQMVAGVSAHFSSPSGAAFSLQTDFTTGWKMSQFSGNYLYTNSLDKTVVDIKFSQSVTSITLTFATADFQQVEVPTTVQLTAYVDSTANSPVGSATAHGKYANSTMPMGTLSFDGSGRLFNLVEIGIAPGQPLGAAGFFIENITAVTTGASSFTSVSPASHAAGASVAPGSIASGLGQNLSTDTASAGAQPLPSLANTAVTVTDSSGVEMRALLFSVSPTQITYLVPDQSATGPAAVTVTSGAQVVARDSLSIDTVAPALFTVNPDGTGPPAGVARTVATDQTQTVQALSQCGLIPSGCITLPIDLGPDGTEVVLVLYATGIRGRTSLSAVKARIGGVDSEVRYAGAQPQCAGLDEVDVVIPRVLACQGEVDLELSVDGKAANTVRVNIKAQ